MSNMQENSESQLIAHISSKLAEQFRKTLDEWGDKQKRVLETLVKLWLALPRELQSHLQNEKLTVEDIYDILIAGLVDNEIAKHLNELGPIKEKFLALLKRAKGKVSQKKRAPQ